MRIKIISAITALCMSATVIGVALTANGKGNGVTPSQSQTTVTGSASSSTALNVIKYGDKLTQDQVMSQIKAQYLIENGGYKDTDEVVVMVAVDGESLIETFNGGKTETKSVSEYAESFAGEVQESDIVKKQNAVISALQASGLITGVEYRYTTVLNAFAVNTVYGNLEKIEKTAGVKSVSLSDTYNRVETQMTDSSANPLNVVDIDENTGIYNNTSKYTGLGTVTAVLDSGFDMSHRVFARDYEGKEDKLVIAKTDSTSELEVKNVEGGAVKLADLKAGQTTKGLKVKDVYYSQKIPFAYDYADKDPDVFPYDSEHGTHVAGIIAGDDEVIHGIAPDTQLVLMKVFPDLDSGGKTEDIIAALEDAVRFKVDAINMSLGTSCGFSRECDEDPDKPNVAKVYDAINDSGISLITAASNSYSAGFGGEQGNTNMVTNPDSGTVGSPSTYDAALSVASISGERSRYADHKLADTATQLFKGWKLNGELIATDYITVEEDITLEAVWAAKITVTLEDEKIEGGTKTITAGVGDDMLAALPDKSGDDTFDGYYIVVDGAEMKLQQGDNFEGSDDGITIKAKYVKFPVEADIGNGNGVEGIDVPKGAVVAEYLAEKLADKLVVKDGYKFDGWYLDADFATELATDAVASESITKVYGKWSWAGNVKFTEQKKHPFVYDSEKNAWKSTNENQGNTSSVIEIVVTSGVANIEFDYWITSENGYDYATIYYYEDGVRKELKTKGSDIAEANAQHLSTTLTYTGETEIALRISYSKDNSGNKGLDAIYIANLKINGIAIFAQAPLNPDAVGTYTTADGTVVTLTAGGGATVGDETVAFTAISENVIGVTLAAGYREITLNKADNSCVVAVPQVSVTYNYGGHGENTVITVDKNSAQTVLAETPVADGFIFRGWYKDAALTEKVEAGSSFVANADVTFYAKWDKAITVTFKYEDNGAHADETDTTLYANDTVTVKEVNFEFDGKVFAGWFTKNENGEFDTQITTGTALTDDVVLYAKWIEKSPFAGTYAVVKLNSSGSVTVYNSATTKLVVDYFGNADIQGYNGFSYGNKVAFAFANGSTTVLEITCVSSYSTSKYYAIYDAATGIIARASGSADLNTDDMFVFIPFDENYKTSDFAAYGFNAGGYRKILSFNDKTAENAARNVYTNANALYVNASFKDFDGKAVAVADIKNALNLFVYNGETLVEEFAKNSSGSFVTAIDEHKGRYADFNGMLGQLFFNGAGVAKLGDEVGTYAQTETGFDVYLSNNTVYYSVELIADGETTMYIAEQPTVKITYNYMGHGVDKEEEVAKNVQYTVTEKPTAEGFKFWGWFEDEGLTTAAKTTYTPTEDKILYAKWTAAVTLKFDYNGQGTEAVVVADKYVGDNVSGIPAVAADVKFGEKVFAGWFLKHDDGSFGEEASTSTVLEGDTTYYAKWVDAPQSYGTYKGWNLYGTKSSETENKFSKEVLVVNANGTYKYGSKSGTLTDEQAAITDGAMVLDGTYYYFNKELGLMWRKYGGGKADGVGTDTDLGVDISKVSSVAYTGRSDVGSSYVAYLVITYKDETTKTAFLYNSIIVANATLEGAEATNITGKDFTVKVNGLTIAKVVGKTVLENDGLAGTYAGDYGEIIVDGYGNVTVGGVAADYTVIAERTIKFVAANSMKEVIVDLGNGTYAKVLDGYEGTYILPDNSTITLDGFGGAGDGKTYVVNGANITIFDGETSTNYGIDVANKQFLGKSVFAGYTFTGSYKDVWGDAAGFSIVFDDSPEIKGHFVTNSSVFVKFTAVLNGNTLTITVDAENCLSYDSGKTYKTDSGYSGKVIVMTLTGDTLKVVSTEIATNNYSFREGSAKCEGFSL